MSTEHYTPEEQLIISRHQAYLGARGGSRRTPAQVAWTNRLQKIGVEAKKKKSARKLAKKARRVNRRNK